MTMILKMENRLSISPYTLTGAKLTETQITMMMDTQMAGLIVFCGSQYDTISDDAEISAGSVMAYENQYMRPSAEPKAGSTNRVQ